MEIQFKACPKCRQLVPLAYLECTNEDCKCSLDEAGIVSLDKHRFYEQWYDQKIEHWAEVALNGRLGK